MQARIPNAIIIGAMKASTTTLFNVLARHSEVFVSKVKEPNHFAATESKGIKGWEEYLGLFVGSSDSHKIILEASTEYTRWPQNPNAAKRIHEKLANPKLIYVVRDPVDRVVSHYFHSYSRSFYKPGTTLSQAIMSDPILLSTSRYASQLDIYEAEFGKNSVLVITVEQLHSDTAETLYRVARYLSIDPCELMKIPIEKANTRDQLNAFIRFNKLFGVNRSSYSFFSKLPAPIKRTIKSLFSRESTAPAPTQIDRNFALKELEADIVRFHNRLGSVIDDWPSVKALSGDYRD